RLVHLRALVRSVRDEPGGRRRHVPRADRGADLPDVARKRPAELLAGAVARDLRRAAHRGDRGAARRHRGRGEARLAARGAMGKTTGGWGVSERTTSRQTVGSAASETNRGGASGGATTRELLRVDDLSRFFGGFAAVADLSFHVEEGEILGLIGPNGA